MHGSYIIPQQCAIVGNATGTAQWSTVNCSTLSHFICEPYLAFTYTLQRSVPHGDTHIRSAYALKTDQRITLFEQIQCQDSTLLKCVRRCLMHADCIAVNFHQNVCQLALN